MYHATGSFSGLKNTEIFTQHWLPGGASRAIVLIAHGYAEHSGRYAHVAAHLVAHGFAVYALDHRGHGRSGGPRVAVRDFAEFVADLRTYFDAIRAEHPALPIFLYGHSMGSLISLLFTLRWQDELAGLITTGTALRPAGANPVLAPIVRALSRIVPSVALVPPIAAAAISRDPQVVAQYLDDPLVHLGKIRLGLASALLHASRTCTERLGDLRLPYLALHGGADIITWPAGAAIIRERSGSPDTTVRIFDGLFHEVHNEPEQAEVLRTVTDWLDAHL
ncbi:MAG: alpha/beta hydrolase [Anaerolineae bacterium]|nr:alpha/beta hydrolase [Anaerolineae bacterium]